MLLKCEQLLLGNDAFLNRRMQHGNKSNERSGRNLLRIKSMREFANHRMDDIRREVALVRAFLSQNRDTNLCRCLCRMVLFEENDMNRNTSVPLAERLVRSLQISAGLDQVAQSPAEITYITNMFNEAIQNDEKIDFTKLLGLFRGVEVTQREKQPVITNLEVCAGAGDWATSQALEGETRASSSKDPSVWITLELRRDRVQQTFSTMLLKGVKNMCVVGGDAHAVMERHFLLESVDNIFINHPEPPERNSGTSESEGSHLLTPAFFKVMAGVLRRDGRITIVTDNLPYGKSLIGIVDGLKGGCESLPYGEGTEAFRGPSTVLQGHGLDVVASCGGVSLFEGMPGASHGYMTGTMSYFDRLWHRGRKNRRFFLSVTKEELS